MQNTLYTILFRGKVARKHIHTISRVDQPTLPCQETQNTHTHTQKRISQAGSSSSPCQLGQVKIEFLDCRWAQTLLHLVSVVLVETLQFGSVNWNSKLIIGLQKLNYVEINMCHLDYFPHSRGLGALQVTSPLVDHLFFLENIDIITISWTWFCKFRSAGSPHTRWLPFFGRKMKQYPDFVISVLVALLVDHFFGEKNETMSLF